MDRADVAGGVPMRWPFADPGMLDLLRGTPVSVLVVPWADGSPADADRPRALGGLLAAASSRGLSLVGWVSGTADLRRAAAGAEAAGLSALATESAEPLDGFSVLRFRGRGAADLGPSRFLGDADAVWPGMRPVKTAPDVDAVSGATSRPWIDSNAWYVRLARALMAPRAVWLAFEPPDASRRLPADAYLQAIADARMVGGRWIVSLDPSLQAALREGQPSARDAWSRLARGLALFESHRAWDALEPEGQIGVLSDFAGDHEFLSFEVLNLLARRSGLYRVLPAGRPEGIRLEGLDSVLRLDPEPPAPELARRLRAFAEAGGTLVVPPGWEAAGAAEEGPLSARFRVHRIGKGRVAVARAAFEDPDLVAEDAQLLTSHRNDRARVFNLGVGHFYCATSTDGRKGVLHALAFPTPYPRGPLAAWFRRPWTAGRVVAVDGEAPATRVEAPGGGVEFHLPPVAAYAALEVSA